MKETRRILVVVDMQNDFIKGALAAVEPSYRSHGNIVENVVHRVKDAVANGFPVFFTRDTHDENYLLTQEGKNLPISHCIHNTSGWDIIPELTEFAQINEVFDKPTFGSTTLANYISEVARDLSSTDKELEVMLIGVCTDICVVSNALLIKAFCPEVKVLVDAKCCAGTSTEAHVAALNTMKSCQVKVINENE